MPPQIDDCPCGEGAHGFGFGITSVCGNDLKPDTVMSLPCGHHGTRSSCWMGRCPADCRSCSAAPPVLPLPTGCLELQPRPRRVISGDTRCLAVQWQLDPWLLLDMLPKLSQCVCSHGRRFGNPSTSNLNSSKLDWPARTIWGQLSKSGGSLVYAATYVAQRLPIE